MKYLALLLLLSGCAAPLSRETASPIPEPLPVALYATVSSMPDFPAPIDSMQATNASRMAYRDFLPQDATNVPSTSFNSPRAKPEALRSKISTNEVQRQAIFADRVMLHNLYVAATNGDEHAKMNYHLLRTNEAFMSRLTNSTPAH